LALEEVVVSDYEGKKEKINELFIGLCVRQINIIMKIVKLQNNKHFQRWADKLIFLGIASEKETARVVVDLLLGKDMEYHNDETFTSTVHNRDIDLYEFGRYIYDTCTDLSLEDVQSRLYFQRTKDGLQMLSEGEDLWSSTNDHVSLLRTFVKCAVLIVPSNTQFVELCVKEGAYIGATNRDEAQQSVLGIIRSFTIREVNNACVEKAKNRDLRANQHTEAGKIGDRSMTKKNSKQDIKTRPIIKGSRKTIELLTLLKKINTDEDKQSVLQRQRLLKVLSDRKLSYNQRKNAKRLARYRERSKKNKKMNKDQKRQDIKHTDMTLGRIAYSSLRNECIDEVKIELEAYEIDYDDNDGIKKLSNLLKDAVINDHGKQFEKSFHPTTEPLANRFPFSIRQDELT
jgi:hypothetical protein